MTHSIEPDNQHDTTQEILMATNSTVIRRNTLVEVSLVLSVIGGIVAGTIWATRMSLGQQALREDVHELKALVSAANKGHWLENDRKAYYTLVNRELEVWAVRVESALSLPVGALPRIVLPDPHNVGGGR